MPPLPRPAANQHTLTRTPRLSLPTPFPSPSKTSQNTHAARSTLIESWQVHPAYLDRARHLPVYLLANGLLLLLMVMQVQWMAGIVR